MKQRYWWPYLFIVTVAGVFLSGCGRNDTLFRLVPASQTGIHFKNDVTENDQFNVLEYMNIYTGAGVAAGDINNDGLVDLYFSGNQQTSRLYLNKGAFEFEDITEKAGVGTNRWCTGVSMVDINSDGFLDIYVNVAGSPKFGDMHNLLYINNGNNTFTESAAKYGIAETRHTMNASFFDYDKDGDLDLFLITNPADEMVSGVNTIRERMTQGESLGTDILYRNNGNETFTDVSKEAGILMDGYSLGAAISDVNGDGWPDMYVCNDFLTNDILYINNGNGTFSDKTGECLKHTSFASMGNDIADFNNDGLPDIYTLDMLPEDNYRKKMIIPAASYDKLKLSLQKGYHPQFTRNTLQLNNGDGTFSDISFLAGVSSTDWSWSALGADYDNDGDKDLLVTNGFYRDLGNLDYINYQMRLQNPMGRYDAKRKEKLKAIRELERVPLQNYLFENNNDFTFIKRSNEWGFTEKGFSNGAAYADLDNDGDLDLVLNCFNEKARVYKNGATEQNKQGYVTLTLKGRRPNVQGIGAKAWLYTGSKLQFQELYPYRGYESSVQPTLHFGLGQHQKADSLKIEWPDGTVQMLYNIKANQHLTIAAAGTPANFGTNFFKPSYSTPLFTAVADSIGLNFTHAETEFVDFKVQPLLPHMLSRNGPGIAVGDVNGDGLEDFYIGGTAAAEGRFYLQRRDSRFIQRLLPQKSLADDMGVLLFDADNDNDLDLYVVAGGTEHQANADAYQDRFFLNDGKGSFQLLQTALPDTRSSGSCVAACDYDGDGDLDLFVGSRVVPGSYPLAPRSYLLRNEGAQSGGVRFKDVTQEASPQLVNAGMVTSALWSDYDNDGHTDLIVAGEFMPVTFYKNNGGKLEDVTRSTGLQHTAGWWNSLAAGDFDQDGDMDYLAGNLGLNSRHKASPAEPLCIYARDYDRNGLVDPIMCYYVDGKNFLYPTRDELIRQINPMRKRFSSYADYAKVTFEESFLPQELAEAYVVKSECFESSYFENRGNGTFQRKALPVQAQFAPLYGMLPGDYNGDGNLDVLLAGNTYSTEASTGPYDALTGLLLLGNGRGSFQPANSAATGFKADKDVKSLVEIKSGTGGRLILVGNNSGPLQAFQAWGFEKVDVPVAPGDVYALVRTRNGKTYKQEFYYGSNYLSQPSRILKVDSDVISITLYDNQGAKKVQTIKQP